MRFENVDFTYPNYKTSISNHDSFEYVQLAKHVTKKTKRKILFVLDYVPSEDLKSGMMLSGATADLLKGIMRIRREYYKETSNLNDINWLCVSYHSCRTKGKSEGFVESAHKDFARRLNFIIGEYKPDSVVTFGQDPFNALNGNLIYRKYDGKFNHFLGRPISSRVKHKGEYHKFKHFPSLSLNTLVNDNGKGSEMAMAGYVARNLNNVFHNGLKYKIPKLEYKIVFVDTVETFDNMMNFVRKAKFVAIDTETENLNRRVNKMLTIQFATSTKRAFVVPIFHKDSPFTPKELKYVLKELRSFFEYNNKNKYHIYANASFDLSVIRNNCGVRYYKNDVWDLFAAEFCFHPDTFIDTEIGKIKIDDFIEMDNKPRVLSFNHNIGETEYKNVLFSSKHETKEEMYELEYEGGTIKVTGNHKIWSNTRNKYIRIDEIFEDEEVLILEQPLS